MKKPKILKYAGWWIVDGGAFVRAFRTWSDAIEFVLLKAGRDKTIQAIQDRVQRQIAAGEIVITGTAVS